MVQHGVAVAVVVGDHDRQRGPQPPRDLAVDEEVLEGLRAPKAQRVHLVARPPGPDLERARQSVERPVGDRELAHLARDLALAESEAMRGSLREVPTSIGEKVTGGLYRFANTVGERLNTLATDETGSFNFGPMRYDPAGRL